MDGVSSSSSAHGVQSGDSSNAGGGERSERLRLLVAKIDQIALGAEDLGVPEAHGFLIAAATAYWLALGDAVREGK